MAIGNLSRRELIALVQAQAAENAALKERIAELERRLGLNSGNSGKPPSTDGLKKSPARTRSSREPSGKKPGGQKGHQGETLRRAANPDSVINHFPTSCAACGAAVTPDMSAGHRLSRRTRSFWPGRCEPVDAQKTTWAQARRSALAAAAAGRRPAKRIDASTPLPDGTAALDR